jgi:hypothetical protein
VTGDEMWIPTACAGMAELLPLKILDENLEGCIHVDALSSGCDAGECIALIGQFQLQAMENSPISASQGRAAPNYDTVIFAWVRSS